MEDYDIFNEMIDIQNKKCIMMFEDDEEFITNNILNSDFELIPLRLSYDLSNHSTEYIENTKELFIYYYNDKNSYKNELLRLKKHFVHYRRFPFIVYLPNHNEDFENLIKMFMDLNIECVFDKEQFLKKINNDEKLILIDSDDTLRRTDGNISERTKKVISQLKVQKCHIVLCTARPRYHALEVSQEIGVDEFLVSSNGAEIFDIKNQRILENTFIEKNDIYFLIEYAKKHHLRFILTTDNIEYVTKDIRNSNQRIIDIDNYKQQLSNIDIKQCMFIDKNQSEIEKAKEYVMSSNTLNIVNEIKTEDFYEEKWFSIGSKNSSKGNALKYLANFLNIPIKNSIAIGDDRNDISMFQASGFSVAMGNSDSKIKSLADYVTTSNNSDGVAKFLERILNNQHK